ncbi:thiopeptide maturation pyridine synthase [Nocardiopsis sp. NPDC057823]|uniref:thiopeptide maturation pyridine synthase n=1 Tax=Nocardiopsis sp. NPDC057823 TaxID=3346256 RepID=UPI00366F1D75
MMDARSWHSIHVHHHGEATSQLVAEALWPVSRELERRGLRNWFVRHWRRGPHLRLNVEAGSGEFRAALPMVAQVLDPYLAALPATETDVGALLPLHRRTAEQEQEPGPLTPWFPDNSWHVDDYDDRMAVHRTPEAAALVADFLRDANEHAFEVTAEVAAGASLPAVVFDTMAVLADRLVDGGIAVGYLSYRSHAEAYLSYLPERAPWRREWDDRYRSHARALADRIDRLVGPGSPGDPRASEFADLIARYRSAGAELYERGLLPALRIDPLDGQRDDPRAADSPFHHALLSSGHWTTRVGPSADFAVYRLALNLMYLQFTRLGITPHHRLFLCHLLAEAVERRTGRSWADLIRSWDAPAAGAVT